MEKLCPEVMVSLTATSTGAVIYSDLLLDSRVTQPSAGLEKANDGVKRYLEHQSM